MTNVYTKAPSLAGVAEGIVTHRQRKNILQEDAASQTELRQGSEMARLGKGREDDMSSLQRCQNPPGCYLSEYFRKRLSESQLTRK